MAHMKILLKLQQLMVWNIIWKIGYWDNYQAFNLNKLKVDIIIITGTFEIELSNSNIILFPGSRLKLNKGEVHSEKAGIEGVSFLSARPLVW